MPQAIRAEGLTKRFFQRGEVVAVDHLDIEVAEGEIFGFLGPNGAGKTTTIKMLLGLIFPDEGMAEVLGFPAGDQEMRRQVSYLPENPYFYDHLTGGELLDFYGRIFGLNGAERAKRVDSLMDLVGLRNDKAKQIKQYSKGMTQRIGIAQALINDPKVLIFDEPTSGLDPVAHIEIRNLIESLRDQGKTIFLSSHQLSDVELVCDRICILNYGKLVKQGRVEDLVAEGRTEVTATGVPEAVAARMNVPGAVVDRQDGRLVVTVADETDVNGVIDAVRNGGGKIVSVVPLKRTLEEIFVETVGLADQPGRRIGTMNTLTRGNG
ncbi:MAG: ABC-type multidrug transport system, ATPase component [Armatimonadetes bacterium]|jgi:ABC-2 type transport system ATP-binding protein|nr:ABC-type multidrug transport system, ATPase component [Armatimonadota bacterium]